MFRLLTVSRPFGCRSIIVSLICKKSVLELHCVCELGGGGCGGDRARDPRQPRSDSPGGSSHVGTGEKAFWWVGVGRETPITRGF